MATAQDIIESAYARSSSNDAGKLAVDGEMLAHLNRKYQHYFALFVARGGDVGVTKSAVALAGAPATGALPADMVDLIRIETTAGAKVNLIPVTEKARSWHLAPAVYRLGNSLVSRGNAGDPAAGETINVYLKDATTAFTPLGTYSHLLVADTNATGHTSRWLLSNGAVYLMDQTDPSNRFVKDNTLATAAKINIGMSGGDVVIKNNLAAPTNLTVIEQVIR